MSPSFLNDSLVFVLLLCYRFNQFSDFRTLDRTKKSKSQQWMAVEWGQSIPVFELVTR